MGGTGLWRLLRRLGYAANLLVFLVALLVLAVVVNYFAGRPELRLSVDATKTRAYSLSSQSKSLLDGLDGVWTIALILDADATDTSTRRQVEEVLRRYEDRSSHVSVIQIDPTDINALGAYESLLARLRDLESEEINAYETQLDAATASFEALRLFAQQQVPRVEVALAAGVSDRTLRADLQEHFNGLRILADEGGRITEELARTRTVTEAQPVPDYDVARSILVQTLAQYADEFIEVATLYELWRDTGTLDGGRLRFVRDSIVAYRDMASRLAAAADPLAQLPLLELAAIGQQLRTGEVVVVIGPQRAVVIPSDKLFPRTNIRAVGEANVAFDRRFRGEQVISAAIRSLMVPRMPMVVFVHSESRSLLAPDPLLTDVMGVAANLDASRFEVREWSITRSERPVAAPGQSIVWIVMPPSRREGREPSKEEVTLVRTAQDLLISGESVMVNFNPSLMQRYRLRDPWQSMTRDFSIEPQTQHVITEAVAGSKGETQFRPELVIDTFGADHPISRAAHGQQAYFPLPVPITMESTPSVEHVALIEAQPNSRRWLEEDWARTLNPVGAARGEPFEAPQAIMVCAERTNTETGRGQRIILVGSGGWLRSSATDVAMEIGGERVALTNPGNHELLLASVAWLSSMDDLISPSASSQGLARLNGIDQGVATRWGVITVLLAPLFCLLIGGVVWIIRR